MSATGNEPTPELLASGETPSATACVNCRRDSRFTPWPLLAGVPVCPECAVFLRNRPFPRWVCGFFAGMAVLVVLSFVWNLRFVRGRYATRAAIAALSAHDITNACLHAGTAARLIPESSELPILRSYCEGIRSLAEDRPSDAVRLLMRCRDKLPAAFGVNEYLAQARTGDAFERADYDAFLSEARDLVKAHPKSAIATAGLASALACKYATTTNDLFHAEALRVLDEARRLAALDKTDLGDYEQRIRYRLQAREIITSQAFHSRFPNGWRADSPAQEVRP